MVNNSLEDKTEDSLPAKTANEQAYLTSMMPEIMKEEYSCVSGCTSCVSCGSNDYFPTEK